jgi:hypothetical protein
MSDKLETDIPVLPVLYTDTIGGKQTMRDDLWAVTTKDLNAQSAELARLQGVVEAARRWNRTDQYQNVEAARAGEDKKIKDLQDALAALTSPAEAGEKKP